MNISTRKAVLMCGAAAAALFCAAPAWAQASGADIETVTVTGSSIRGVAPVGSNLVTVDRADMEKAAAISATEITDTLPAITQAFSAAQGENTYSYYEPSIHGLGGSASSTTLVIVDGLRMPGGGTQFDQKDPNIIPSSALQRVEVLADGASSVYGSDAVAGVVNYITRTSFEGLEVSGKVGIADGGWDSHDVNAIWGTHWSTGGVYVAGQYAYQTALANNSHAFLDKGNYLPQGQNLDTFNCSPATIRTPASGANIYLSPSATTTVSNATANAPCNNTIYGDVLPSSDRKSGLVRVYQSLLGDRLTLTGTADYGHLQAFRRPGPGAVSGVTAFGPGSGAGGQINPFYVAPAGQPTATTETITWAAITPNNNYGLGTTSNDTGYLYGTAEYKINDDWIAKLSDAFGRGRSNSDNNGTFCSSCATLALNGTTQSGGSTTTSSIAGANIIALNTPLTTSNAIDVWHANGGGTSASTLQQLYSVNTDLTHWNSFNQTKAEVEGPLFDLPAGPLRFAAGVEYMWTTQDVTSMATGGLGSTQGLDSYFVYSLRRNVYSGYMEANIPLVSPEMGFPLVEKLDLDISGRYDHYSDVGVTSNPKFAANWEVTDGLRLRGNYATAFVAPPLNAIGIPAAGYRRGIGGASLDTTALNIPVALYPQVTQLPGCAGQTVTCQIGGSALAQGLSRSYGVGANAKNETGNSWSLGIDFSPTFLPGFTSSATYWSDRYKNGVDFLGNTYQVNILQLGRLTLCPGGCTTAQINAFTNIANGGTLTSALPATVSYLRNMDLGNVVNLHVQGVDFDAQYRFDADKLGQFTVGINGTEYTRFDQDYPGLTFSILGTSGSNQTYPSVQGHARMHAGWQLGDFSLDSFVNWTSGYHNWSNLSQIPVISNAAGALLGGGDKVDANVTLDVHAEYNFKGDMGWFGDSTSIYVDVKNLLDNDPPFYSGNTSGIAVGGNGYNGFVSSPLGRIASIGFRANY